MANPSPEQPKELEIVVEHGSERASSGRRYPLAFHDFATGAVMRNPVVVAMGDSHELSSTNALEPQPNNNEIFYPNRALKDIIQEEEKLAEQTLAGSVRRLDHQLKAGFGRVTGKSLFGGGPYRPLPESLYCPITCGLMEHPCITKEGITYERRAIEKWIQQNGTSPMTRTELSLEDLRDNNAIYDLLQEEKGQNPEEMHPSIRRWKEEEELSSIHQTQQQHPQHRLELDFSEAVMEAQPADDDDAEANLPTRTRRPNNTSEDEEEAVSDCKCILVVLLYMAIWIPICIVPFILFLPCYLVQAIVESWNMLRLRRRDQQ